jgi:hypothetical protein
MGCGRWRSRCAVTWRNCCVATRGTWLLKVLLQQPQLSLIICRQYLSVIIRSFSYSVMSHDQDLTCSQLQTIMLNDLGRLHSLEEAANFLFLQMRKAAAVNRLFQTPFSGRVDIFNDLMLGYLPGQECMIPHFLFVFLMWESLFFNVWII